MQGKWTAAQIPDQGGRLAIVTGATSGIGFVIARELARAGARLVLAVRDDTRGGVAAEVIRAAAPRAQPEVVPLDLASLASVRRFAQRFTAVHEGPDLLINNAGVMATPHARTVDGFELQFGTNHLGHFTLTGLLIGAMRDRAGARVVTVSSFNHRMGRIDFEDLQGELCYRRWKAYNQSKLANLLFAFELDRRLRAAGAAAASVAAHPGYADTALQGRVGTAIERRAFALGNRLMAQSADMGALPVLYAAAAPGVPGGSYVGPDGVLGIRGHPAIASASAAARDPRLALQLWEVSERLTGVTYPLTAPQQA